MIVSGRKQPAADGKQGVKRPLQKDMRPKQATVAVQKRPASVLQVRSRNACEIPRPLSAISRQSPAKLNETAAAAPSSEDPFEHQFQEDFLSTLVKSASKIQHWYRSRLRKRAVLAQCVLERLECTKQDVQRQPKDAVKLKLAPKRDNNAPRKQSRATEQPSLKLAKGDFPGAFSNDRSSSVAEAAIGPLRPIVEPPSPQTLPKISPPSTPALQEAAPVFKSDQCAESSQVNQRNEVQGNHPIDDSAHDAQIDGAELVDDDSTVPLDIASKGPSSEAEDPVDFTSAALKNHQDAAEVLRNTSSETVECEPLLIAKRLPDETPNEGPCIVSAFRDNRATAMSETKHDVINEGATREQVLSNGPGKMTRSENTVAPQTQRADAIAPVKEGSEVRMTRIMHYLRSVEEDAKKLALSHTVALEGSATSGEQSSTPTAGHESLKAKLLGQELEIEEKTRTLILLKKELKRVKDDLEAQATNHQKELKSKLTMQRREYETIIKRHLAFIDKILAEKEELSKRCDDFAASCKSIEKQFKDKVAALEEAHARELKQKRDMWEAAEKIQRDKWIQEKTKFIKDQTIKGLEPEIQRMLAQHKAQMKRQEEQHREDLTNERQTLTEQHQHQIEQYRDKIAVERRRAAEEEREFARQRYQKQLERDELEFQQQKRKLTASFEEQKDHIVQTMREERKREETNWGDLMNELKKELDAAKRDKQECIDEQQRQHQLELSKVRDRIGIEKEEWQAQILAKIDAEHRSRETQLRNKLVQERDAEIEMVIQRLESEGNMNSSDAAHHHRLEIERLRSDHAEEAKQLREQANIAIDKVLTMQSHQARFDEQSREFQKQLMKLEHENAAKDSLLKQQKQQLLRLQLNEDALREAIRKEYDAELEKQRACINSLKEQQNQFDECLANSRRQSQAEIDEIERRKESELQVVENRVRAALLMKDEMIKDLASKAEDYKLKCSQLEVIIDKQRKELLS